MLCLFLEFFTGYLIDLFRVFHIGSGSTLICYMNFVMSRESRANIMVDFFVIDSFLNVLRPSAGSSYGLGKLSSRHV